MDIINSAAVSVGNRKMFSAPWELEIANARAECEVGPRSLTQGPYKRGRP